MPDISAMESNYVKLLKEYNDLAEGYERLQQHLDEETKFHQEQTSQNVAVMTDMQDTITQLRNQLAELRNTRSASSGVFISEMKLPMRFPALSTGYIRVFNGCMFSRAFCYLVLQQSLLVTCFRALSTSHMFLFGVFRALIGNKISRL